MKAKAPGWLLIVLALAGAWLLFGGKLPALPSILSPGPSTPPLVVMLHEADHGGLPAYAVGAANDLREAGRDVRMPDDDPANGLDAVPAEIAPAIEPGRKIMGGTDGKGNALVLVRGATVVKAIPLPASKEAIVEACQ